MSTMLIKEIKGQIKLITGLHIGAGNDEVHIGGIDSAVVKDAYGNPYIPGSSLKGKIRSLLELSEGSTTGNPSDRVNYPHSLIPIVFGDMSKNSQEFTRVLFRDAFLSKESIDMLSSDSILPTEEKSENSIDRIKGVANYPRKIERVIAGMVFDFSIALRILDTDNEGQFKDLLKKGFEMLEADALGGSGSRGYGKVKFENLTYDGDDF